ncbi:hypothetical protein Lser_V15G19293 [Lactuca serriola]
MLGISNYGQRVDHHRDMCMDIDHMCYEELLALSDCKGTICEAIGHFKLGSNTSPRDLPLPDLFKLDDFDPAYEVVKFYLFLESWFHGDIDKTVMIVELIKDCWSSSNYIYWFC